MKTTDDLHTFLNAAAGEGLELDGVDAANLYASVFPERYKAATPPTASLEQDNYDSIWNALHRIDSAAAMLPTYTVDHEGGIEAFTQNIVDAITRLAQPTASNAGEQEAPKWPNVETAMEDPLFQQARAIMGTNTWFQDNALRNVINYVLSTIKPPACKGIPRKGCNYLAPCDTPCNKCGEIHHHYQMVANFATKPPAGGQITHVIGIDLKTGEDKIVRLKVPLYTAPQPEPVAQDKEALVDLIAQHLSGTYHCTRVWGAWRVGTMSQDDFEDVGESDTPAELADAILASLNKGASK